MATTPPKTPTPAPVPDPVPVFTTDAPAERYAIATTNKQVLAVVTALQALGAAIDKNVPCGNNKMLALEELEAVLFRARLGITQPLEWK